MIEKNPFFSTGYTDKFLNQFFKFNALTNFLIAFLLGLMVILIPMRLINYLEITSRGQSIANVISSFDDYAGYVQILFAFPIYIAARKPMAKAWQHVLDHLTPSIIDNSNLKVLNKRLEKLNQVMSSKYLELFIFIMVAAIAVIMVQLEVSTSTTAWYIHDGSLTLSGAISWYVFIPINLYLTCYWVKLITTWTVMMFLISRSKIKYNAFVPDKYCGISFLQDGIRTFSILIFAQGIVNIATFFYKVNVQGMSIYDPSVFVMSILYIIFAPLFFIIPMAFFTKGIKKAKESGIRMLVDQIRNKKNDPLIYDLNYITESNELYTSLDNIKSVHVMPIDLGSISRLFLSAIVPMLPVIIRLMNIQLPDWLKEVISVI